MMIGQWTQLHKNVWVIAPSEATSELFAKLQILGSIGEDSQHLAKPEIDPAGMLIGLGRSFPSGPTPYCNPIATTIGCQLSGVNEWK